MSFELRPLPFVADALGDFVSIVTLRFHRGRHRPACAPTVIARVADREATRHAGRRLG
jgi:hypothetical protein